MCDKPDTHQTIYHYCGIRAFHGILTSKQIWMSDVHFMNDYSEQTWFLDKARGRLKELSQEADGRYIRPLIEHFDDMGGTPYVCCFSREEDLLSQWRAYADDGAGFAIGFSSQWFEEQGQKYRKTDATQLWEVEYEDKRQSELLDQYIERYLTSVKKDGKPTDPGNRALLALWTIAAACKNRGFREEKESRFVSTVPYHPADVDAHSPDRVAGLKMCFRPTDHGVIPYFVLPFPEVAVTEIRLGPKNYARDDEAPLRLFLKANGYDPGRMKIIPAEATYHGSAWVRIVGPGLR